MRLADKMGPTGLRDRPGRGTVVQLGRHKDDVRGAGTRPTAGNGDRLVFGCEIGAPRVRSAESTSARASYDICSFGKSNTSEI